MIKQENAHIVLAALDEGDTAIVVLQPDADGRTYRIIETNATHSRMTNYTAEETQGTQLHSLHCPSTDKSVQVKMDEAMREGKSLRGEIEYASRVGRPFWLGFTLLPIIDPATRRLHCVLLGRDITEKRKQDSQQFATQAMLANVFQKIDVPATVVRSDGFLLLANAAFQALVGYGPDEVPRLRANDLAALMHRDTLATLHQQQLKDGKPYEIDVTLVCKDGTDVPVHLRSVKVERSDMESFRVVTIRPVPATAPQLPVPFPRTAILGGIQFLGLGAIKEAYGARWGAVQQRLWLAAENILRRRLSADDLYSRTADEGFCIWFKNGAEEENAARAKRIGREICIMLLGELGSDTQVAVSAHTQVAEIQNPAAPSSVIMNSLTRSMEACREQVERQAKEFVERVMEQQHTDSIHLVDRSGKVTRASFVDLQPDVRVRFENAMSLVSGERVDVDIGLFRLALAANAIREDLAQGRDDVRLVTIPFGLFSTRQGREQFLQHWRSYPSTIGRHLVVVLSELPPNIRHQAVSDAAALLRSVVKRIGIFLGGIEALPFNLPYVPFSLVGLSSDGIASVADETLSDFILKIHDAKARVLIRLSAGEPTDRWQSLGADFTATM